MKISNWLKSGKASKKMQKVNCMINCNPAGSMGASTWGDYVQISFYSQEKERFLRLEMTLEEAKNFQETLNKKMKAFE
jgi:hypothetical protein